MNYSASITILLLCVLVASGVDGAVQYERRQKACFPSIPCYPLEHGGRLTQWCPKNSLPESNICNNPELADRYNRNCSGMLMCGNLRCYNDQKCAKCMSSRFDSWADAAPVYRCSDAGDVPTNYCNLKRRNPGKKPTCNCGDETGQLLPDQNQNLKSTSDFLALLPPASLVDPQSSQMDGFGNAVDFASTPVDYFTTPVVETINLGHDTANLADN